MVKKKTLLFENNLEVLTLDELGRTQREENVGTAVTKVRHHSFIEDVCEQIDKRSLKPRMDDIYVRKGGPSTAPNANVYPFLEEQYGKNAIEAHVVRKLVTKVFIDAYNDKLSQSTIGIGFNQHGMILAYGQNVHVCNNMSIWGENVLSNYGSSKMSSKEMFARFGDWLDAMDEKRKVDQAIIVQLQEMAADHGALPHLIGKMQMAAVRQAYMQGDQAPFNINQVTDFTKNYLKRMKQEDKLEINTMWDVYNIGTRLLRATDVRDLEPIYHQNQVFGNFIADEYAIEVVD